MDVTVVDSTEGFGKLRSEWQGLLQKSRSDCIFLTWEWLFTWWKWYGHNGKLLILLLRDQAGILRGLAPLMVRRTCGAFRKVLLIGSESRVCSEYLDIIAEKGWEGDVALTVVRYLLKNRSHWDVCLFSSIREDSPFLTALQRLPEARRFRASRKTAYEAPYIALPSSWDEFLAGLGSKTRFNVRRNRRKLEKAFKVEFSTWERLFDVRQAVNAMRSLQRSSISRKELRGVFDHGVFRNFHAEIMSLFHKNGWLYTVFLTCDSRLVAFWYGYPYFGRCYFYQTGFDLGYSSYSVGSVVTSFALQHAIDTGMRTFEYLRGGERYKYHFANSERQILEALFFNGNWSGLLMRFVLAFGEHLRFCASRLMGSNLKDKLRALMERG